MIKKTYWKDIMVRSLQKMFLIDGSKVERNDSTNSYIAAMPGAYNEAVELLSTVNRYIINYYDAECDGTSDVFMIDLDKVDNGDGGIFELKPNEIYFINPNGAIQKIVNYEMISNTLYLNGKAKGTYRIYYYAYPLEVTYETPEDTDLMIDPDVAALIPLYIASQLYKDDDISIATIYRNEFESARDELVRERNSRSSAKFACTTGWWS